MVLLSNDRRYTNHFRIINAHLLQPTNHITQSCHLIGCCLPVNLSLHQFPEEDVDVTLPTLRSTLGPNMAQKQRALSPQLHYINTVS